ncbi:helix-turn-helix transcriptional regulator [Fusobacterium simiae]|uniref:Helix-turn-helix transcriptional regulator n=1 Tax=Fusobacterium simiae TaxID=855 RepID=A0ABT4DHR2_FUSSI|nr:helix-turn-helix transcriptional regulator [Fusobacterium simiae]MCY7008143.1 helix-turn-helix transcriptional regulator [Fusobacterium simiae]
MKLNFLNIKTPKEIQLEIAKNVRKRRKELKLTQEEFSKKSGVSFASIKRFENTGEISLFSLIKIAIILECEDEFLSLFQQKQYNSIEELINEQD